MTKPIVIYHANCTDGFGAAFAAWLKLGDDAEYLPMNYADTSPDMMAEKCRDREVYILDFSFSKLVMEHIFTSAKRVVWLDHHLSAFQTWGCETTSEFYADWPNGSEIRLVNSKSGALLAWEFFYPDTEVPLLIRHIDDRDRWQWKMEGSAALHAALWSYQPWSFEQWRNWAAVSNFQPPLDDLYNEGAAILRAQNANVKNIVQKARMCEIQAPLDAGNEGKLIGLAVNAPIHQSEIGHELANASGTFGLVWYLGDSGGVRCSLRSNGDYDVSAIARSFGGGGHRNAAGFEVDIATLLGWLK